MAGFSDMPVIIKAAAGAALGALVGAKLLSRLSGRFIRIGFGIVMVVAAAKMLVF